MIGADITERDFYDMIRLQFQRGPEAFWLSRLHDDYKGHAQRAIIRFVMMEAKSGLTNAGRLPRFLRAGATRREAAKTLRLLDSFRKSHQEDVRLGVVPPAGSSPGKIPKQGRSGMKSVPARVVRAAVKILCLRSPRRLEREWWILSAWWREVCFASHRFLSEHRQAWLERLRQDRRPAPSPLRNGENRKARSTPGASSCGHSTNFGGRKQARKGDRA